MKSRFISDPQDPFGDGVLDTAGDALNSNFLPSLFSPAAGHSGGSPSGSVPPLVLPTPTPPEEAVQAQSAQNGSGGPGSVVAETSGGITFNLEFDAAAMAAPQSFRNGIEQAASMLSAAITDKITVNIAIDYSGTGGGAAAGPDNGAYENYSTIRADLVNNATKGDPTFEALPTGSTVQGQSQIVVWNAQLKLWGLLGANDTTTDDGSATFATDINSSLLVGVALHELTHAIGRVPYGPPYGPQPDIFDLDRFTSVGTQLINGASTAQPAYFSVDGGYTKLADYGQTSDPSDFLNSGVQGGNDPFNEFYTNTTTQGLTVYDLEQLDALGFHLASPLTTTIQTDTNSIASTSLVQFFSNYYLENASSGVGPELKIGGVPVVAGQFAPYSPVGAAQTATGYEIAWQIPGTEQFSIWNTDSNGNFTSFSVLSGTSPTLESLELSFNQDLNGDGVIGPPATTSPLVIESFGSTSLVQVGIDYFMYANGTQTGPELKFDGAAVTAGQFGAYAPVGAEILAGGGYEVAWKLSGTEQFSIWNTDSNGNFTSYSIYSGSSPVLESLETSFHQDLNGDGVIGLPVGTTLIQTDTNSFGSTSLVEVGSNYYLESASNGSGPELKFGGAAVTAGQFGSYVLVGAALLAGGGYEVAWKIPGTEQFSIWNTDSNGNYLSFTALSGTSTALESLETSFNQDLNGDGVIGIPAATGPVATGPAQAALVSVSNNDTFVFRSGGNGSDLANAAGPSAMHLEGLFSAASSKFAALFHDAQTGQLQTTFEAAYDAIINSGNHGGSTPTSFHFADLHLGDFFIR